MIMTFMFWIISFSIRRFESSISLSSGLLKCLFYLLVNTIVNFLNSKKDSVYGQIGDVDFLIRTSTLDSVIDPLKAEKATLQAQYDALLVELADAEKVRDAKSVARDEAETAYYATTGPYYDCLDNIDYSGENEQTTTTVPETPPPVSTTTTKETTTTTVKEKTVVPLVNEKVLSPTPETQKPLPYPNPEPETTPKRIVKSENGSYSVEFGIRDKNACTEGTGCCDCVNIRVYRQYKEFDFKRPTWEWSWRSFSSGEWVGLHSGWEQKIEEITNDMAKAKCSDDQIFAVAEWDWGCSCLKGDCGVYIEIDAPAKRPYHHAEGQVYKKSDKIAEVIWAPTTASIEFNSDEYINLISLPNLGKRLLTNTCGVFEEGVGTVKLFAGPKWKDKQMCKTATFNVANG